MPRLINNIYEFGEFRLDPQTRMLWRSTERVPLTPKAFETLLVLVKSDGQVIPKSELMRAVWPDSFVEESNLTQTIFVLRKALGETRTLQYILTVPGRGYRFMPAVKSEADPGLHASERQRPAIDNKVGKKWVVAVCGLLVLTAAATLLSLSLRRPAKLPFEAVKTLRLSSDGQTIKAAISPDGRYVARTVADGGQESLRIRRATTLHDVEVVPAAPVRYLGIVFSPDSESIYYVSRAVGPHTAILYRVAAMGGSSEKLEEDVDSAITVSPEGKRVAFIRESGNDSTLTLLDLESRKEQKLASRKLPEVLDYPAWSPDGRVILCTATDSAIANSKGSDAKIIAVLTADGTERELSRQSWGFVKELSWLSDGNGLVTSGRGQDESGFYHVWYISYPGGTGRIITNSLNSQVGASISADSHHLVTVEESNFSSIWRVRVKQAEDPQQVSGSSGSSAPVWTSNGQIAFEEELDGRRSIWTVNADGSNRKQLTLAGNNYDHSVSPDGKKLAWISDRSGRPAIWTMEINGGDPVMISEATGEPMPELSPDGTWMTFAAIGSEHWRTLWRIPSNGGTAVELNKGLWVHPVVSPDGKAIAGFYAEHHLSTQIPPESLAVIASDGGLPSKVIPIPTSISLPAGIRWSPDGRGITFVNHGKDGDNIWNQPLDGSAARQVTHFHGFTLFSFDWSQDGTELAFSRGVKARDVVLLEDLRGK